MSFKDRTPFVGISIQFLEAKHNFGSSFYTTGQARQHHFRNATSLPNDLQPTLVQRKLSHHPWLDLLPIPKMRDNLIRAGESYDEEQLGHDMKGKGATRTGSPGIIVWRDPWDSSEWEVSEAFVQNWFWVISGCADLFRSTNYWWAQRGERPLFRI